MSRIGKLPISVPSGVEVNVSDKNVVNVKGKLGELSRTIDTAISVKVADGKIVLDRATEQKRHPQKR